MGELDFDELDKAVNDLMTNVDTTKRTDGLDDPEDKVVTIPTSTADESTTTPVVAQDDVATPAAVPPSTPPTPSLATKRRGQFMDIVHPSLNMTTPPKFSNQHGTTIRPSKSAEPLSTEAKSDLAQDAPTDQPGVDEPESSSQSDWPDPIDMANDSTPAVEQPTEASLEVSSVDDAPSESTEPEPLSSPFLTDTKVEKRPLGGSAPTGDVQTEASLPDSTAVDNTPAPAPTQAPALVPKVLPAEFGGDVMAVESNDLSAQVQASKAHVATAQPVAASPMLNAGGSISQQYTEKPSSGDQTNGAIYDTATYHQALDGEKPAKKSSPVKWIIWIVVLLLVGAAGGAAYFYFTR